jgi:hypothetical protein
MLSKPASMVEMLYLNLKTQLQEEVLMQDSAAVLGKVQL